MWKERATDIHPNKLACKHSLLYDQVPFIAWIFNRDKQ